MNGSLINLQKRCGFKQKRVLVNKITQCSIKKLYSSPLPRKLYSTATNSTDKVISNVSISPYPIRVTLVGVAATLGTPAFVFAGFVQLWMRYLPKDYNRIFKIGTLLVVGGGLSKLSRDYVLPFLSNHSEIVFPLALCNGLMASFWYGIGELLFGLEVMLGTSATGVTYGSLLGNISTLASLASKYPIAGPAVGALTAITSPFLWNTAFHYLLPNDMKDALFKKNPFWMNDAYDWIMFPVGVPIGALAGLSLQSALTPIMKSSHGPWYNRSIPALIIMSGLSVAYYTLCHAPMEDYYWYRRIDPKTGNHISINATSNRIINEAKPADKARTLRSDIGVGSDWSVLYILRNMFTSSAHRDYLSTTDYHPTVFHKDRTVDIAHMDEYQDLWMTIDILIRYRYLKSQVASSSTSRDALMKARRDLEKQALISLGINDLGHFYHQAEDTIQRVRINQLHHTSDMNVVVDPHMAWEDPNRINNTTRTQRAMLLLQANARIFEDELHRKLRYRIPDKTLYQKNHFWFNSVATVSAVLGIGFIWTQLNHK